MVAYMNIYSAAGMVTLDQMTHKAFSEVAKKFVGKGLVMAAHPCIDSTAQAMNSLKFVSINGELQGMVMTANSKRINIFCFEYFQFSEPPYPADFIGKNVRYGGILARFEVNPSNSKIWISRLHITNAFAREMTPR